VILVVSRLVEFYPKKRGLLYFFSEKLSNAKLK
jgi:hypothetical protein